MSKTSRAQNMTNVVFCKDNVEQLHKALNIMYEIWLEVAGEKGQGQIFTIREVQTKLDNLVHRKWKTIQDVFLNDGYHGYKNGSFSAEEDGAHAKLIMDLIKRTDDGYMELKTQIDQLYNKEQSQKDEIHGLRNSNLKLEENLTQARWKVNQAVMDTNNYMGRIAQLEQLNKEKSEAIMQLQRDATVELWGKEKEKILEKAQCNMPEDVKKQYEKEKCTMREKIKDLEIQLKKSKMAAELKFSQCGNNKELEEEKKLSFILEKDMKRLDEELFNLQKQIVGLLEGLRAKFSASFKKFRDSDKMVEMDPLTKDEFERVEEILEQSRTATADGVLGDFIKKLGIYYQAKDSHIQKSIVRKITTHFNIKGRLSPLPDRHMPVNSPEPQSNPGQLVTSINSHNIPPKLEKQLSKQELKGNPQLLYSKTNAVNMMIVLKYFPFMLKENIEELWQQFTRYDKNADGTLDLAEVMTAIAGSFGGKFTAPQVREAMIEVDSDGSGDMDFFEYVSVANMLKSKAGHSLVYRSDEVQEKGRKMSKVCSVM